MSATQLITTKNSILYCGNERFMQNDNSIFPYKYKVAALLALFILLLLGCRLIWSMVNSTPDHPQVSEGILDMRGWDVEQSHSIPLQGEWEFYPDQLLGHNGFPGRNAGYIQVPGDWSNNLEVSKRRPAFGYGTYRLRILVDPKAEAAYGFWIQRIQSASEVEINGEITAVYGRVATEASFYQPVTRSYTPNYTGGQSDDELELVIRVANFSHPPQGGIVMNIRFGSQEAIARERSLSIGLQLVTFMILLLHMLYAGILYYFNRKEKALLTFLLLLAVAALSIMSNHDSLLLQWLPLNDIWMLKVKMLAYLYIPFLMLILVCQLTDLQDPLKPLMIFSSVLGMVTLFILGSPLLHIYNYIASVLLVLLYGISYIWLFIITGNLVLRRYKYSLFLLFTATAICSSLVWGSIQITSRDSGIYYPFDLIAALIGFSTFWFKKYFENTKDNAELYRRLSESSKRKDEFLANTAHELRTPLHGIINLAQSVLSSDRQGEHQMPVRNNMGQLISISRRMSYIVNSLLDLSRLRDHRLAIQPGPVSIHSTAAGVTDMMQNLIQDKPVTLSVDIPPDLPLAFADEKRVIQILINLLNTAVTFTESGAISITAKALEKHLLIQIKYKGYGIAAAELDTITGVYEIAGEENSGIGLGLIISRQLVELHGGSFQMSSTSGEGSLFSFTLPVADTSAEISQNMNLISGGNQGSSMNAMVQHASGDKGFEDQLAQLPEHKLNILAVDDHQVNLKVLASILPASQFSITMAGSGLEVLNLLTNSALEWDLLIADVMMPQMSGYELTRRIRKRYSHSELPILLLTARNQIEDIHAGFSAGANDYVSKPANAIELQYRVWSLATLKRSVHERLRMEAAYLQAQIRPQFIISTLNAIMALSITDIEQMRDLSEAFTTYLRISFDTVNSDQWIMLRDELDLVRAYLHVENALLSEPITIIWEIGADLSLPVPPLLLQPFVENAVNHGLRDHKSGQKLYIRVVDQSSSTLFQIRDNGVGMEDSQIHELLNLGRHAEGAAGIPSTNRRLLQRYGRGLTITSIPGEGTSVSFEIPQRQKIRP
ncbi:ATP-binding protein [Paenibacillus sp. MMS20-IR301]|uniref:ATP-binding protein n=1 Tax=Paenibacillus sp. MMS20-IR301 TaxID=2895946 RepID=UPI0028E42D7F|nr:ATP-binding protein [Paenibacillus sp. MMS20-IR301]WNS45188.1 response regulator [Paenibacillus sp. MMS20-IR301]